MLLEESGHAFFHHYYSVFRSCCFGFLLEQLQWFIHRFVREAEGAVVHGDHPPGLEIEEGAHGVGRIGVDVAELRRIVGADGKQREFGSEAASNLAEAREVGGIAGVIDGVLARLQYKAAVTAMRIFQDARSPMPRGNVRDREISVARAVPPVQFDDFGKAQIRHEVGESHTLTRAEALKRVTDTWAQMDTLRFDLNIVIDGGDGEHVAMVWDSTMAKDGNEVKVASIEVFRVVNGQIVEVWNCGYKLGVWS